MTYPNMTGKTAAARWCDGDDSDRCFDESVWDSTGDLTRDPDATDRCLMAGLSSQPTR